MDDENRCICGIECGNMPTVEEQAAAITALQAKLAEKDAALDRAIAFMENSTNAIGPLIVARKARARTTLAGKGEGV